MWRTTSSMKNGLPSVSPCSACTNAGVAGARRRARDQLGHLGLGRARRARAAAACPRGAGRRPARAAGGRSSLGFAVGAEEQRAARLRARARGGAAAAASGGRPSAGRRTRARAARSRADLAEQRGDRVEEAVGAARRPPSPRERSPARGRAGGGPNSGSRIAELGRAGAEPRRAASSSGAPADQPRSISTTGWYGVERLLVEAPVEHDRAVVVRARGRARRPARVLPMPASPASSTSARCRAAASRQQRSS